MLSLQLKFANLNFGFLVYYSIIMEDHRSHHYLREMPIYCIYQYFKDCFNIVHSQNHYHYRLMAIPNLIKGNHHYFLLNIFVIHFLPLHIFLSSLCLFHQCQYCQNRKYRVISLRFQVYKNLLYFWKFILFQLNIYLTEFLFSCIQSQMSCLLHSEDLVLLFLHNFLLISFYINLYYNNHI